jgi:sigma-B regulation protein RsbU (phosphoserine phosphatase)
MPIILENRNEGSPKITELQIKGMPICSLLTSPNHEIKTLQMEKGDKILLYTDGVTEAFNREKNKEFGTTGLENVIRQLGVKDGKRLAEGIVEKAKKHAGRSLTDDMAVLILELL